MSMRAIVKSVLSGDTLVLRGRPVGGQPPKERTLHLAGLDAPRNGTRDRADEPWAFESRNFTRLLLVGKEVAFSIAYTTNSGSEFGLVHLLPGTAGGSPTDVALEIVRNGWSKLRDQPTQNGAAASEKDDDQSERRKDLKEAEEEARREKKGMWTDEAVTHPEVAYAMPADPAAFLSEHKGKPIPSIVESVSNGSTLRVRLMLSPTQHQLVTLTMAGVRAPKARAYATNAPASTSDADGEECGDEARFFSESRLLQRNVTVRLLSLPTPAGGNFASGSQATIGSFIGLVVHPRGSVAALLLASGLARVVDWHAGFLSSGSAEDGGGMERLRVAEKEGKTKRLGVWKNVAPPTPANGAGANGKAGVRSFEGVVTRVWTGDSFTVRANINGTEQERRVQLSSLRLPRANDPKLAGLTNDARELMRKRVIGKTVSVSVDYVRPPEGNFEEKECATIKTSNGVNLAELLVERGYANVIRHRQGEDRAADYDQLMAAETKAQSEGKGLHSGKEFAATKTTDISETAARATSYISQFKRQGRVPVVVDYVASGSRFKIFVPKLSAKLTLVLAGIRCPRTARSQGEKPEPGGVEAFDFTNKLALQRDAEMEIDSTDKSGGFIGALYLNRTDNLAALLAREGLATIDERALERLSFAKSLREAEELAKKEHKNLWKDYDHEAEAAAAADEAAKNSTAPVAAVTDYQDIIVSDIRSEPSFSFAVQVLKGGGIPELSKLMEDFSLYHSSASNSAAPPSYRSGDLVSAKFTADDAWYRAKVRKSNPAKKEAEVLFIDYGNSEVLPYSRLRSLDPRFKSLSPQAKEATLSFVKLLGKESDYAADALDRFRSLAEGQKLVANIDYREPGAAGLLHLSLYDPSASPDATSSLNNQLVREGLAQIDRKARYRSAYPAQVKALDAAREEARRSRAGAFEFGDTLDEE